MASSSNGSAQIEPRENVPRKIERILSDMTRQLMSNAAVDEDIEVVVKLQLGQSKPNSMRQPKMKCTKKPSDSMYRIKGCFNATVTVNDQKTISDSMATTTAATSPSGQLSSSTNGKSSSRRELRQDELLSSARSSSSANIVTLGGLQGPTTSDISNLYGRETMIPVEPTKKKGFMDG